MGKRIRDMLGLNKHSAYVSRFLGEFNIRSACYIAGIGACLEFWMILSFIRMLIESAAAGTPRDPLWAIAHGGWYVVMLVASLVALVYSVSYVRGKTHNLRLGRALIAIFVLVALVFGIHFGNNSYVHGEQILAFVTMTMFAFCVLVWRPIDALIVSAITFGGFYLYINHNLPATYGTQVNLFTLWISTVVVAISTYQQAISGAKKDERIEQANDRLHQLATTDELTGIPNMHSFDSAVCVLFEGIEEFDVRYSILYMDIENFKAYNDKHGFLAGDDLLRQIARGLSQIFCAEIVARFSDDHFVALCESEVATERALAASELVRSLRSGVSLRLKTGIYNLAHDHNVNPPQACDKARMACEEIKRHPDATFNYYDERFDTEVRRRQHVINNVKRAVAEGWIKVYYQPVVRCADGSGELCGYEALARWDDPEYGFMPPYAFIQTLEEFREIDKLDRCIVEQVCRDLRAEMDAGKPVVPVSINFSRLDFELYDVPAFLDQMSRTYNVPSSLLDVEITESALAAHLAELQKNMMTLHQGSYSVWLDDFGSGYSSLNVLKDFSFNVLKIDMAFLRGFENNAKSQPILRSIVELAKKLGMVTLCEGVESREQFEFLTSIGCDRAQGFYFGKPEPAKQLPAGV